jgi:hypothetical protein
MSKAKGNALIHHQGIISPRGRDFAGSSGVTFDRSSRSTLRFSKGLRRIAPYASVVA